MPETLEQTIAPDASSKLSLQRAFDVFQRQAETLERSHQELRRKLDAAQLSLARKNEELARKIAETEAIKRKLTGILASIDDAVLLVDADGGVEIANKSAAALFAAADGAAASMAMLPEIAAHIADGRRVANHSLAVNVGGEERHFLLSVLPMSPEAGEGQRQVVSLKDITEQEKLRERANREDRLAAIGKVAANVAHEIRNPLGGIEGFARLLERDLGELPKQKSLAGKIVYGAQQLNSVVTNLLNYAREMRPVAELNDVAAVATDALVFVQPIVADNKVELTIDFHKKPLPAMISGIQLRQVVTNLVINAIDACSTRSAGHITISARQRGDKIILEVADNGGGIAKADKKRVFEPFFTMKEGGVGLGLALCQRIVETHGGEIDERGIEGEGARFVVKLPKAELKFPAAAKKKPGEAN